MTDTDSRLARIRKLLAQAEDPAATPGEAAAFTAKATRLMADHGIDRALVDDHAPDGIRIVDVIVDVAAPYAAEKAVLGSAVAAALRCQAVRRLGHGPTGKESALHVFGRAPDLACFELLFTSLLLQGTLAMTRTRVPLGEHKAAYRRTWWLGFTGAIERRLAESERAAAQAAEERFAAAGTSAALVLADHSREAEEAMHAHYPALRTAPVRRLSGSGVTAGWMSGQRADLGRGNRLASGEA